MTKSGCPYSPRSGAVRLLPPSRRASGGGAEPSEAEGVTQTSCAPLPLPRLNASKAYSHGSNAAPPVDPSPTPQHTAPEGRRKYINDKIRVPVLAAQRRSAALTPLAPGALL